MVNHNIQENHIEKSLITKEEKSLTVGKHKNLIPILKTTTGVIFYIATFVVSVAVGYVFIFSVFN